MIDKTIITLPSGIRLSCRTSGTPGAPLLMFLHGFPEGAFVWDELLEHFGTRYRCIAPNLRGYELSSAPAEVEAYRAKHVMADIAALLDELGGGPLEALIAHDWGGAVAWNFAVQSAKRLKRLVIINSPHPGTFLRELQTNPAQQAASAYMNFLRRPDAEALLAENDYARMWPFFSRVAVAESSRDGSDWLTDAVKDEYRAVWSHGLQGPVNFYRASPIHPPTGPDDPVLKLQFPPESVTVQVPTSVIWAEADAALLPSLIDGLEAYVPKMKLVRIPRATHWVIHEQPQRIAREIDAVLAVAPEQLIASA
ncbi:MAG: alpha/beta fold hydrolase [Betaproteobacteria bacterium]|nr:MAG: alpha/beta fold hydrolase [Betaproteobacteria bacterium]TMH34448.1 MAG: alpha/beta fold hydrolase [Betaproteobacteria bacterium]